jgi:hypothetical protein
MSSLGRRFSAMLLASALAFGVSPNAQARGFGGFGGGGHFGGGGMHFGGGGLGGMHLGGGGLGGIHLGGGGLGGMRLGGLGGIHLGGMRLGGMHLGGMRLGGMHLGGSHFGGLHPGGRGFRVAGRGFHVGGRGFARNGLGAHHFAGRATRTFGNAGRAFAARNIARGVATVGAAHLAGRNFAQSGVAHAGFGNNWHNNWRGRFPHPNPGFRNWWGYGWYGPVFWPFAYDVLYADLFWPWYYDYPFWAYGYPDLYGALFWPYGYDDLAGYLPSSPGLIASSHGGTSGSVAGVRSSAPSTRIARVGASRQAKMSQISQSCGEDSKEVAGWPIDRIEQTITPTADQRALLDDFANASIRAAQAIKEACPTTIAFAPTGRLDAMERRIAGMVQAIDIVGPPLDTFYASLTDEQKARLNAATDQTGTNRSLANCGAVSSATQWPGERIEMAVRPDAQQQSKLDALRTAMANAADELSKACPSRMPATPPARLRAISMRLDTMLASVKNVRGALDDFYGSLTDEQKQQFNLIGREQTARQS